MLHIDTIQTASNGVKLGHLNGSYFLFLPTRTEWQQIPQSEASCFGAAYKWFAYLSGK